MRVIDLGIPGLKLFQPQCHEDGRGFFMETFRQDVFEQAVGMDVQLVQDNHSRSAQIHTVRGLHYQAPPKAQGKLVRCTKGAILDVAVDIRVGSGTFGQHVAVELSADNKSQLWIPAGFLHGFATRATDTEVQYKCCDYYDPALEGSVRWDDAELGIDWGFDAKQAMVSPRDLAALSWAEFDSPFNKG